MKKPHEFALIHKGVGVFTIFFICPILMMIRNSFASFSTSRLKMLPDNYSGSKLDTKKPSVKMSARHHHHLCRLLNVFTLPVHDAFCVS